MERRGFLQLMSAFVAYATVDPVSIVEPAPLAVNSLNPPPLNSIYLWISGKGPFPLEGATIETINHYIDITFDENDEVIPVPDPELRHYITFDCSIFGNSNIFNELDTCKKYDLTLVPGNYPGIDRISFHGYCTLIHQKSPDSGEIAFAMTGKPMLISK